MVFTAALVAWLVAFFGDGTVRNVKRLALGSPENRALTSALAFAVGPALQDVPEQAREPLEAALRERFSEPPVFVLDGHTRVRTGLIQAIAKQIEPLSDASITPAGRSFLDEIGVDSAWLRDELVDVVIRSIEQVGPSLPALAPLLAQLNADAIIERVDYAIELIGAAHRRSSEYGSARLRVSETANPDYLPLDWVERLTEAFLAAPSVADDNSRQTVLRLLPNDFRGGIPHSSYPRIHVVEMITAAANRSGGLKSLVRAVRILEGDSVAMKRLDDLILELDAERSAGAAQARGEVR
jgi:hypothetical protein